MLMEKIRKVFKRVGLYPHRIPSSGKYGFLGEIIGYVKIQKVYNEWRIKDQPRLQLLKNCHKEQERCFIIGNGPSLNQMDLTLLKNETTFGVNAIFLNFDRMGFKPTYYVSVDNLVCEDRASAINSLDGMIKFFPIASANVIKRDSDTIFMYQARPDVYPDFSTDISKNIYGGSTVTYTNMQLAYYMGFKDVYLIGMDHCYTVPEKCIINIVKKAPPEINNLEADLNHFHPDYFGPGFRWHDMSLSMDKVEAAYKKAKEVYEADGRSIYNATAGGKLEIFPRVDYSSLFCK